MNKEEKKDTGISSDADNQQLQEALLNEAQNSLAAEAEQQPMPQEQLPPQQIPPQMQQQVPPQSGAQSDSMQLIKQLVVQDINKIKNLMQAGIINPLQGQTLMNQIIKKAYNSVTLNGLNQPMPMQNPMEQQINPYGAFVEFEKEKPDFFNQEGRNEVLNYLKNANVNVDKDEISKISQLVEMLEQSAINRYQKQTAREKTLNDENEAAKSRLRANAQNAGAGDSKAKVFTREQIGKMSGAEFAKNERIIMEQLRKGLIR